MPVGDLMGPGDEPEQVSDSVFRQVSMNRFEHAVHTHRRERGELSTEDFADHWDWLAERGWHVVAPDMRGHGASDHPDGPPTTATAVTTRISYAVRPVPRVWIHDKATMTVSYPSMPKLVKQRHHALMAELPQVTPANHGSGAGLSLHVLYADGAVRGINPGSFRKEFDAYRSIGDLPVNGNLTLGENIADLGGLAVAYDALQKELENKKVGEIDGLTPDQRFFLNWATVWRRNFKDEELKVRLKTDSHAPANFRAIGAPSNLPQFAAAFGCKEGDPMVRAADGKVAIW